MDEWGADYDDQWVCHYAGDRTVSLDGHFTVAELRDIADRLDKIIMAQEIEG